MRRSREKSTGQRLAKISQHSFLLNAADHFFVSAILYGLEKEFFKITAENFEKGGRGDFYANV
jgi:hypothetical protein